MTPVKLMTASATALTIALSGPIAAQQADDTLPPGQMKQLLDALADQCETDAEQPDTLNCTLVTAATSDPSLGAQVVTMAESMVEAGVELPGVDLEQVLARGTDAQDNVAGGDASPAPEAADAADPQADTPEADSASPETEELAEAPEEQAPEEDAADQDVTAEAPAEAPEEEETVEDTVEATEPTAEAEAESATDQDATAEAPVDAPAEEETAEETVEPTEPTAEAEAENADDDLAQALEQAENSESDATAEQPADQASDTAASDAPEVPELDDEAQAAAVAESENRVMQSAAAASASDEDSPEAKQETVTEENVRQSTEDFDTDVTQAPDAETGAETQEARSEDDDDDGIDPIFAAGAVAFGAAVLADILQGDDEVVSNSGDRVVIENNGQYRVLRNDDVLLRRPGAEITTYEYNDGSTRNVVSYDDGTVVETVRAANGQVLRRTRTLQDGTEVVLFDDTQQTEQVVVNELPQATDAGTRNRVIYQGGSDADELERALAAQAETPVNRRFSLNQVRNIDRVRELVPEVTVNNINFESGSAAIRAEEAEELRALGLAMRAAIERNPGEVFLIEGHTDAVGSYAFNLALSDRRAESVALALTEYFDVPPENMVLQGYGESDLLIETQVSERANRRAAIRRITPLLQGG
ncbi:OmpA family protein [uncultured Marivita sp.]|uniref:OmpA family protein n=1 Tax=uncultured Marivita sp. TaxID=888080 RepID=UPI00260C3EFA|nr:OmpA family protein [uncultured Marivita sp.]